MIPNLEYQHLFSQSFSYLSQCYPFSMCLSGCGFVVILEHFTLTNFCYYKDQLRVLEDEWQG